MHLPRTFWRGLIAAAILVAVDQAAKFWILNGLSLAVGQSVDLLPFLSFTMVWNKGISMGLPIEALTGQTGLILLTSAITLWLINWLRTSSRVFERWALALIIGGAVGNLIDRFIHGAVVDFIHFHAGGYSFYVFNVADAAITIGVALLLFDSIAGARESKKAQETDG